MRNTNEAERTSAGRWLGDRRRKAGLTQLEVARAIGSQYPTMVGQIEHGKAKVPPAHYAEYARVLKMEPEDFVKELIRHYDPEAWKILFGPKRTRGGGT